jgi:signal transduction histidine kinase
MLRISEEELTQRSVRDFYVEAADREALLSAVQQSGYVRDYGIQLLRHDGSNFYASLNMSQLVLEGNEVLLTMVEDVTDKILAETALRENEQRFKALFESLPLPSYYWQRRGEDFVLIKCNNAADEFTDGGTRKLIGWTATKMYPDRPDIREDFYRCYIEKVTIHREMEYTTRSSGEDQVLSVTYAFSPPDLVIVQTQDISDRKKLEFQLAEAAARAERERLARELHDAVTQTLFTASILAQTTPRLLEKNPAVASQNMKQLDELLRGALAEMRILLLELRPTKFGEKNLAQLFDLLTESTRARTGVNIIMNVASNCSLPQDVAIAFYRITQESLNNVAKYALASEVVVDLSCDTSGMLLSIKDDGRGFDPSAIPAGHMGVSIMRARAQEIGASLKIDSEIGRGTQVTVSWSTAGKKSALGDESEHE